MATFRTLQIRQNLLSFFDQFATSQILQNLLIIFRPICDVADLSNFIGHLSINLRCRRFVKIYWLFLTNLRRRSVDADTWQFIGNFSINLLATSQIRQNLIATFRTLQILQNLLAIFDQYATSQLRLKFVTIYWLFSTNHRCRWDVADSSKFIGHFSTNHAVTS